MYINILTLSTMADMGLNLGLDELSMGLKYYSALVQLSIRVKQKGLTKRNKERRRRLFQQDQPKK